MKYFDHYKEVQKKLLKEFKNIMSVPRIEKITINMGIKEYIGRSDKAFDFIVNEVQKITCQKPRVIRAKKSCDSFSIRKGDINALQMTLRGKRMYSFLHKLLFFALPRSKNFEGFSIKAMDGRGNMSFGINDCTIFYEVDRRSVLFVFGFNVNITTTAKNDKNAIKMLSEMYLPFTKK